MQKLLKKLYKSTSLSIIIALIAVPFAFLPVEKAHAANPSIRQEINIFNKSISDGLGSTTTIYAIVKLDTTQYTNPTYYFEGVMGVDNAGTSTLSLFRYDNTNGTTTTIDAVITTNGSTTPTVFRSAAFTPPAGQTYYVAVYRTYSMFPVGKYNAARIVVIDSTSTITTTETQIEIGNEELNKTNTSSSSLTSPKYWKYNSANWDASTTFYVDVSVFAMAASSTSYTSSSTIPYPTWRAPLGSTSTVVWAYGGGGGGGSSSLSPGAGSGGAGGTFASTTFASTVNTSYTIIVGGGGAGGATGGGSGARGATTTFNGTTVVAPGGAGGLVDAGATSTGSTAGCVPSGCYKGGDGARGNTAVTRSGGGGGGAGTTGNGGNASSTAVNGGSGTSVGGGAGGNGINNTSTNGNPGTAAGGGGSGGYSTNATDRAGGAGAAGKVVLSYTAGSSTQPVTVLLQEDNGSFANWTTKVTIATTTGSIMPTHIRSSAFTPTANRNYRIATFTTSGGIYSIYNAKIIARNGISIGGSPIDSYSGCCGESGVILNNTDMIGQTFTGGGKITAAQLYLGKSGSPTGNGHAQLFLLSGGVPTGSPVAISDNFDVSTLSTTNGLVNFTFSGANQYGMSSGAMYGIAFIADGVTYAGGSINYSGHASSPTHPGCSINYSGSWSTNCSIDRPFSVTSTTFGNNPSNFQSQYLLLNTAATSTGLRDKDTTYNPTDWSGVCTTFYHAQDAIGGTANTKLQNLVGPTDITNSSVTGGNQQISSALTMPTSSSTLDTYIVTVGTEVDASRILVAVNTNTSECSAAAQSFIIRLLNSGIRIKGGGIIIKAR